MTHSPIDDELLGATPEGIEPPPPRRPRNPPRVSTVDLRFTASGASQPVDPALWEERVAKMIADEQPGDVGDLRAALATLDLRDAQGGSWRYDGSAWAQWHGAAWTAGHPRTPLRLHAGTLEVVEADIPETTAALLASTGEDALAPPAPAQPPSSQYAPTHLVPAEGMPAWSRPDPTAAPVAALDPWLDVMVTTWRADGWTQIMCSNGWTAWVDGELLLPRE